MQEWMLVMAPLTAVLYFVAFHDQLRALLSWVGALVN